MKLKLPQQLLLALLTTFTSASVYAADVALTQSDANADKWYESGTIKNLNGQPLGQTNFTIGENITFTGYDYQYEPAKVPNPNIPGGMQDINPSYGNIFRYTKGLGNLYAPDMMKGDAARTYSISFNNNTSIYNTPRTVDNQCQSYGGAAYFGQIIFSDLNNLTFSGNSLVNTLGGTAGKNQPGLAAGGAMYITVGKFTQMNSLVFTNNTVESNYWAMGGGLYAGYGNLVVGEDKSFMSHIARVVFDGNKALSSSSQAILFGGGLCTNEGGSAHYFTDLGSISFTNNLLGYGANVANEGGGASRFHGGAAYMTNFILQRAEKLELIGNSIDSSTQNFEVKAYGGAMDIAGLQFYDVVALDTQTGGLSIHIEGNKAIVNHSGNNKSTAFGGAIYSRKFNIVNSGHVLFKDNYSSTLGGAIYLSKDVISNLAYASKILAMKGDITFVGNTHQLADNNERNSGIANSIYLEGGYDNPNNAPNKQMALTLAASEGKTIYLYDPMASTEMKASNLRINFGGSIYKGTVVFSGEKVIETLAGSEQSTDYADRVEASKKTEINAEMVLWGGSLVLKEGVTLGKLASAGETGSIFYHAGMGVIDISHSTLVAEAFDGVYSRDDNGDVTGGGDLAVWKIGAGAKLVANTIDLSDGMAIDVEHYKTSTGFQDHGGMMITATSTSLGGNLKIADHADYYTDNTWSKQGVFTLFDVANASSIGDFNGILSSLTGSNVVDDLYQYQGEWSYEWVGTKFVATWKPLGGITDVHPELEGNIISNSMWSSASNVKSLSNTALTNANILRMESSLGSNFWVKGIGDFAYDDSSAELDGYSYQGGGYAAGADFKIGAKSIVGFAFGQLTGDNKSELYNAKIKQESMMGSIYAAHLQTLNKRNSLLWTLAGTYGSTDNSMNTHYSDGQNSSASWNNNAYFVEAKMEWRIAPEGKSRTYKPFIGLEYTDVSLDSFSESGDKTRHFADGKYKNLALPIGMGVEHQSRFGSKTWLNSLSLAYVPDVYREAPSTQATRLSNGFTWKDQGSKPSIHTLRASINSTLQLNAEWTAYAGYTFEAREGANYHNVNTGVSYSF